MSGHRGRTTEEWLSELTGIAQRIEASSLQAPNGNGVTGCSDISELSMITHIFIPCERLPDAFAAIRAGLSQNPDPTIQQSGWQQLLKTQSSLQHTFEEISNKK